MLKMGYVLSKIRKLHIAYVFGGGGHSVVSSRRLRRMFLGFFVVLLRRYELFYHVYIATTYPHNMSAVTLNIDST